MTREMTARQLVEPFPEPSRLIRTSIAELQMASESTLEERQAILVQRLPKPWEPASCSGPVRAQLWAWLDDVVGWINRQHLWSIERAGVPECWPQHPHLVHDLAVVACCRYVATFAFSPAALEGWHRAVLPAFLDRLDHHMGGGCLAQGHATTPRAHRDADYRAAESVETRRRHFAADLTSGTGTPSSSTDE